MFQYCNAQIDIAMLILFVDFRVMFVVGDEVVVKFVNCPSHLDLGP
jgi:hypothetical protein